MLWLRAKKLKLMSVGYKTLAWLGLFCVFGSWIFYPIIFEVSAKVFQYDCKTCFNYP